MSTRLTAEEWTEIGKPYGFTSIQPLFDPQGAGHVLHMTYMGEYEGRPLEKVHFAYYRLDETRGECVNTVKRAHAEIAEALA